MKCFKKRFEFLCIHLSYTYIFFILAKRGFNYLAMKKMLAIDPSLTVQELGIAQSKILDSFRTGSLLALALIAILLAVALNYSKDILMRYSKVKNTLLQAGMSLSIFFVLLQLLARLFNQYEIHLALELLAFLMLVGISILAGSTFSRLIGTSEK